MASERAWVRVPLAPLQRTRREVGAHEFRNHFGYYMERAAAGEEILVTRRGKPHARLGPPRGEPARARPRVPSGDPLDLRTEDRIERLTLLDRPRRPRPFRGPQEYLHVPPEASTPREGGGVAP